MAYIIGQIFGVIASILVVVVLQLKHRKHILWASVLVNTIGGINVLLLNGFSSGVIMNIVAISQILVSLWHEKKGTQENTVEKVIFCALYIVGGILGYTTPIDILAIVAAVFYMLAMSQKKEQRIRMFLIGNMVSWTIYHGYLGSTGIFAQIAGLISSFIGIYRYRQKKTTEEKQ